MNRIQRANAELLFYAGKDQPKVAKAKYKPKEIDLTPTLDFIANRERVIMDDKSIEWLTSHGYNLK